MRPRIILLLPLLTACHGAGQPVGERMDERAMGGLMSAIDNPLPSGSGGSGGESAEVGGGGAAAPSPVWSSPKLVLLPPDGYEDQDPFVTKDGLALYFQSTRPGSLRGPNIWRASRASVDDPWGEPAPVDGINSDFRDVNPVLSNDELHFWFARSDGGDYFIYESTRPTKDADWSTPTVLPGLGGDARGVAPSLTEDELTIYLHRANEELNVDIYRATRASKADPFGVPLPLVGLNSSEADWDVFSRDDLVFAFTRGGTLYTAERPSREADFGPISPLLDSAIDTWKFDPWVSPDGKWVLYGADEGAPSRIYEVRRE